MPQDLNQTTAEQDKYLSTLLDVANIIQKTQINLKKCPKQRLTKGYVQARLKTLEEYWSTFKQAHNNLTACTPREQKGILPYFLNEDFYQVEDLYVVLQADLTDHLLKLEVPESNMSTVSNDSQPVNGSPFATLPRIQLPMFSGKYEDWPSYQDLFTALVHNTNLSNVQKLHYLKTSVCGEAELLLRHIQTLDSNYLQAWELLKGRFGNKKMILNSVLKRLFGQKKIICQSSGHIKNLLDTTSECINSLNNLQIRTDSWDPILIFLVSQKLDPESLKDWEEFTYKNNTDLLPTWDMLKGFLESKFRTLEVVTPISIHSRDKSQSQKSFHVINDTSKNHTNTTTLPTCTYCQNSHYIYQCKDFSKLNVEKRQDFVKNNRLCYNCLIPNHNVYKCKQSTSCRICKRKHHSLLHHSRDTNEASQTAVQSEPTITAAHFSHNPGHEVLLATAQVEVISRNGHKHLLRALIDQGSEASFVSARVVDLLGLSKTNVDGLVSGVGEGNRVPIKHLVDLTITSRFDANDVIHVKAYVLKNISSRIPSKHITINCAQLQTLPLADPTFNTPGKIDMLLGADVFCKIIEDGLYKLIEGVVAQKTCLGWILSGQRVQKMNNEHNVITLHIRRIVKEDNDLLRKFWEIETDTYKRKKIFTKEEEMCEQIYKNTTKREVNGRYTVHLPLKQSIEETVSLCGDTKEQAIRRFESLERKFAKSAEMKNEYTRVINEYKEMGHMKESDATDNTNAIYLPHHAVIRQDKETSKLRVVYDASARGSRGLSLNDCMMVGSVLQQDLRSLIISWRTHKICIVGDIVKMYRMINMTPEHTNLQRIVWRDSPDLEFKSYNLTTVTFGTAAAPYLAVRTLHQLADDESHEYPDTALVIKNGFYMDDLMVGHECIENTKKICDEIKTILKRGGFKMQKWSSNSEEVLEYLQEEKTKDTVEIKLDKIIKILGLTWDRNHDEFKIAVNLPKITYPITKRTILSDVARLFDPFGWLSPVVISGKILIQKLWLCSLGWDDELPDSLREEWTNYREGLIHLRNIKVPRWFKTTSKNINNVTLHGFSDASTQAYAAVVYLRVVDDDDAVHVTMIASRTKVAPLKQLSVPRLELCAAVLLVELINDVVDILKIAKDKIFAWTDSMVVLSWLQAQPNRWHTFVANRVAEITRILDNDRWRHVRSIDNPADISTRCIKPCDLASNETWWSGPTWLKEKNSTFHFTNIHIPQTQLESKIKCNLVIEEQFIWERFSTISRMKRVLAYCRRMLIKRDKLQVREKYLQSKELDKILKECIKFYQNIVYNKEIEEIKKEGKVKVRSSLISLSPFLDSDGILRVGGRLHNSSIPELSKHPIIIPANQHITKLLVNEAHTRTLHGGIQLMMSYLRTAYWIIGLKSSVKKCIRNCKICVVDRAKTKYQLMGQLPAARVNQHRAFLNSGVDYAGPVWIRSSKGRGHQAYKGYICLFVCMATRAIHLEAVTDLTTQAFIAAFRRFVARRGYCQHLWSENGTNFVGSAKELKCLLRAGKDNIAKEVAEVLANEGTTWHFIPARMPTCGGLWEAGIQSVKRHLTRVNKDTKLTYEEMTTLLAQIEACLNSRPLCYIDNTTEEVLTPGHFLIGEPVVSVPDVNYENKGINLLTRWQLIQKLTQNFWNKWRTEYLNTLQQRHKWQKTHSSPSVGDVVVVKDEALPPTKWILGRIKQLHPGPDDLVRVVTIQCQGDQLLKRPLYKVIPIPKDSE